MAMSETWSGILSSAYNTTSDFLSRVGHSTRVIASDMRECTRLVVEVRRMPKYIFELSTVPLTFIIVSLTLFVLLFETGILDTDRIIFRPARGVKLWLYKIIPSVIICNLIKIAYLCKKKSDRFYYSNKGSYFCKNISNVSIFFFEDFLFYFLVLATMYFAYKCFPLPTLSRTCKYVNYAIFLIDSLFHFRRIKIAFLYLASLSQGEEHMGFLLQTLVLSIFCLVILIIFKILAAKICKYQQITSLLSFCRTKNKC